MHERTLDIAVAGHTNTGKTSLMRTVLRDAWFGEVDDRPGVTRYVEAATIALPGGARIRFSDTPGLEDAVALLEHLDGLSGAAEAGNGAARRDAKHAQLMELLSDPSRCDRRFRQEAAALAQVAASDLSLYVLDARERVLARHRDELELLARCARPVVPVLNFAADPSARTQEWRDHLARSGLHAVAVFDTVVFDPGDERRLFEMMRVLLPADAAALLEQLDAARSQERTALLGACARVVAELLIDAAAIVRTAPAKNEAAMAEAAEALRNTMRRREQACVDELLALCRFRGSDVLPGELPLEEGRWPVDLFSPEALRAYGVRSAGLVATGAAIGLSVDIVMHGLSLGAGTALGAAFGGLAGAVRHHGRRLVDRARGFAELRVSDVTLELLLIRQTMLLRMLMMRGHAAVHPIELRRLADPSAGEPAERPPGVLATDAVRGLPRERAVRRLLRRARAWPGWALPEGELDADRERGASTGGGDGGPADFRDPAVGGSARGERSAWSERGDDDEERARVVAALADRIATVLESRYTPPRWGD